MAAIDPVIERDRQRADPAAEADPAITDFSVKVRIKFDQNGDGRSKILNAAAQDVTVLFVDIMQHMPCGIFGNRRVAAAREASETGKDHRGIL
jgi:hypothetical protein